MGGKILRDPYTSKSSGSRYIDPLTKDYALDSYGRLVGMNKIRQLVQLAVSTDKGSSAMRSLGHELRSIERITSNFQRRVLATLTNAVQHLVKAKLIAVVGVSVQVVGPGKAKALFQWRDLQTGEDQTTEI